MCVCVCDIYFWGGGGGGGGERRYLKLFLWRLFVCFCRGCVFLKIFIYLLLF